MSITRNLFKTLFVCVLLAGFAAPAFAQDASKVEVSGGYNLLHVDNESVDTVPGGWYADVTGKITPTFGVVGQVTGNYKTIDEDGVSIDAKLHTFMAGVRVNGSSANGVAPFAQVLFGATRLSASSDLSGALPVDLSEAQTEATLQVGGGLVYVPSTIGVKVGADYLRIFSEDEGTNAFRFAAGVVFKF